MRLDPHTIQERQGFMIDTKTTFYELRKEVTAVIDQGGWYHSWHLPKDKYGYIDWMNRETVERCLEIVREKRAEAEAFMNRCNRLMLPIAKELEWHTEQEALPND